MATEVEKLVVTLEARLNKYQSDLTKMQAVTNQKLAASEARFAKWSSNLQNTASTAASGIGTVFSGLGAFLSAHALADFVNEWNRLDRSIEASSQTFGIALKSSHELVALANDSRVDVEAYAKTYVRAAAAVRDYGFTSDDAAVATSVLAKALKVGQAAASEQASTILQFSQALQKGKLDGDEFRTVMENAGVIQELLAKKLGVTKGAIVQMAGEGKLKLATLIGALIDGQKQIDRIFSQMPMTIDEAFSVLRNNVVAYIGDADKASGASQALANAILGVANNLDAVAVAAGAILGAASLRMAAFAAATVSAANPLTLLAAALGALGVAYMSFGDDIKTSDDNLVSLKNSVNGFFEALGDSSAIKTFEKLTSEAFDTARTKLSGLGEAIVDLDTKLGGFGHTLAGWASNVAGFISDKTGLSDLINRANEAARVDALNAKASAARSEGFGGQGFRDYLGSTNRRPIENLAPAPGKYERDIDRIKKQTEALKAQMAVIEQTTFAQEKAKAASDLLFTAQQQATKNGTSVTAAQRTEIEKTAEAYAAATVQAKFLAELQSTRQGIEVARSEVSLIGLYGQALDEARTKLSLLNEAKKLGVVITPDMQKQIDQTATADAAIKHYMQSVQELQDISKDALSGFLNDLREGKSLAESFANVLDKLAAKLIDSGIDRLVTSAAGGLLGSGGGLGSLLGLAGGGYVSGPGSGTSDSIPAQLSNGEYVINAAATKKHKALLDAINSGDVGKFAAGGRVGSVPSVNLPTPVVGGSAPVLNFAPVINAQNASPQAIDKINSETLPMLEKIARRVTLETLGRSAVAKKLVRT